MIDYRLKPNSYINIYTSLKKHILLYNMGKLEKQYYTLKNWLNTKKIGT
jgi:hypothetical protein